MLQLFQIMKQEGSQLQFMLDISRSMSKAYADIVGNFIFSLTNLALLRRNAYLCNAYPNPDAFRLRNPCSASILGGDLFDRALMQQYEHHLVRLLVKPGSKKDRFHQHLPSVPGPLLSTNAGTPVCCAVVLLTPPTLGAVMAIGPKVSTMAVNGIA